jgi:hypothetical protein
MKTPPAGRDKRGLVSDAGGIWTRVPFRWPVQETGKIALFPLPPRPVDARRIIWKMC